MIEGRYGDTSGRPYIEGRLSIPRINSAGEISFILDTGADKTLIMPLDAGRIGINYSMLNESALATGIGGYSKHFVEPAIVAFSDSGHYLHVYFIEIRIASPSPDIADIPSLLGRDILDNWAIAMNSRDRILTAEVLNSDLALPLGTVS